MSTATVLEDIRRERERQQRQEGWTQEHDDTHQGGELAVAASCYAHPRQYRDPRVNTPFDWPWESDWWKPTDRRRDLIKAATLLVAEIERLDRKAAGGQ